MINISGHLREERKITGYYDQDVPLIVNCCGKQVFQTQDYFCNRKNGRLDYQIIYIHRGSGHFYLNNEWITLSAGNIVLYRPGIPQYYSYYAKEKPEIYWIHFTGNECENILKQYDIKNCYIGERLYFKLLFQDIITELQLKKYLMKTLYCIIFIFSYALFIVPFIVSPDLWIMIFPLTGYYLN